MQKKFFIFISIFLISITTAMSQSEEAWFPEGLNIRPFTANVLEPRAGFSYLTNLDKLELNIGTSSDIYKIKTDNFTLSFGADMFTFTRLMSENDFKFPVQTIDYFFGINSGYKVVNDCSEYGFRIRLSHISTHMVDGSYNKSTGEWENATEPIVYSREFVDFFPFYQVGSFRGYIGLTYLFHVIPDVFGKEIYQAGFDYYITTLPIKVFSPYIAYDFKLSQINKYTGNNVIDAGIKFGKYDKKGFSIFYSYKSGKSIHGQYYNLNENYSSIGVNLDL
ncbi:MAG: DUF1207 domain-containing protein [Ignavibacteriaceae bacterium]